MNIDRLKLKRDLARSAFECTELKRMLRGRWTAPMGDVQRALIRARRRTTELHVLCAYARGRRHLAGAAREAEERIATRLAADYAAFGARALEVG